MQKHYQFLTRHHNQYHSVSLLVKEDKFCFCSEQTGNNCGFMTHGIIQEIYHVFICIYDADPVEVLKVILRPLNPHKMAKSPDDLNSSKSWASILLCTILDTYCGKI